MGYQELIGKRGIDDILSTRERALQEYTQGMELLHKAQKTLEGGGYGVYALRNSIHRNALYGIENRGNLPAFVKRFANEIDKDLWRYLGNVTGMVQLMDHKAREQWEKSISESPPECTLENLEATFAQLDSNKSLIFQRGLFRAFCNLCGKYKTNDPFKVGKKIIVEHATGIYNYGADYLNDVERVLYVLDGKTPPEYKDSVRAVLAAAAGSHYAPKAGTGETEYMSIKTFKKGTAHVWLLRDDLTDKVNKIIADYCGASLPDGTEI